MKKNLIKKIVVVFFLNLFWCESIKAVPYSERHAFCIDRSETGYGRSYEAQKRYNNCMLNAEYLIKKYEREQEEYRRKSKEMKNKWKRQEQMKNNKFDSIFGNPW